jgi:hypothetical protein
MNLLFKNFPKILRKASDKYFPTISPLFQPRVEHNIKVNYVPWVIIGGIMVVVVVDTLLVVCDAITAAIAAPVKIPSIQAPRTANAIRRFRDMKFLFFYKLRNRII